MVSREATSDQTSHARVMEDSHAGMLVSMEFRGLEHSGSMAQQTLPALNFSATRLRRRAFDVWRERVPLKAGLNKSQRWHASRAKCTSSTSAVADSFSNCG
jgi:hypothetical protein